MDLEAARRIMAEFADDHSPAAAAILKHTNPCGAALGATLAEAYQKAYQADSVSAFGGIVEQNSARGLISVQNPGFCLRGASTIADFYDLRQSGETGVLEQNSAVTHNLPQEPRFLCPSA